VCKVWELSGVPKRASAIAVKSLPSLFPNLPHQRIFALARLSGHYNRIFIMAPNKLQFTNVQHYPDFVGPFVVAEIAQLEHNFRSGTLSHTPSFPASASTPSSAKNVFTMHAATDCFMYLAAWFAAWTICRRAVGPRFKALAAAAVLISLPLMLFKTQVPAANESTFHLFADLNRIHSLKRTSVSCAWELHTHQPFASISPCSPTFTLPYEASCRFHPKSLFSNAAVPLCFVESYSKLYQPRPVVLLAGCSMSLLFAQTSDYETETSQDTFIPNHTFKLYLFLSFIAAATLHLMPKWRQLRAIKRRHHAPFVGRQHQSIAAWLIGTILCYTSCVHSFAIADILVSVDPNGQDTADCNLTLPCKTINYAINTRRATNVLLSDSTFAESSIRVDSITPFLYVSGLDKKTVFDCSLRKFRDSGPAFMITNASIAISGIMFQNCSNFDFLSGTGGVISAESSVVLVDNCDFVNNFAQTGGAIGAIFSALTVTSSTFRNNTATCPSTTTACSAWGGAIAVVEASSVKFTTNSFSHNTVNLKLNAVKDSASRAAGGGGCISVLYNKDADESRVLIDENIFQNCSVRMFGTRTSGIQYGNSYGGAVSLYYGLLSASSLKVYNSSSSFTNNICQNALIETSVEIGGNAFGGCFSVYAGAWSVTGTGGSTVASVFVERMVLNINGNSLVNCRVSRASSFSSKGTNAYGGGISLMLGACAYSRVSGSLIGYTMVSNSSYTISNNTLTNCTASSSTSMYTDSSVAVSSSNGLNAYGGGISLAAGAYFYSSVGGNFTGNTTVSNSIYTISRNTLINCAASSSTSASSFSDDVYESFSSSQGANVYGGGISVLFGAYVYVGGIGLLLGNTTVSNSSYTISRNTLTNCTASSSTSMLSSNPSIFSYDDSSNASSNGLNAYGGGISLVVGDYFYGGDGSIFSGCIMVSNSSYTISRNMLTNCAALSSTSSSSFDSSRASAISLSSSRGANVYGGGISLVLGAYVYVGSSGSSSFTGDTTVSNSSYTISSNTLLNCTASSSTTTRSFFLYNAYSSFLYSSSSNGTNSRGGGISLAVGAYIYSAYGSFVSSTAINNSVYAISNNILTRCIASASLSASSFSNATFSPRQFSTSSVSASSASLLASSFSNTTFSLRQFSTFSVSISTNAYGGGIMLALGAEIKMFGKLSDTRDFSSTGDTTVNSGDTTVNNSSYTISNNTLTNCAALSSTLASSSAAPSSEDYPIYSLESNSSSQDSDAYGGGISLAVGAYFYAELNGKFSGYTTVSNSSYTISSNTLVNCTASSSTSSSSFSRTSISTSKAANVHGGGISLVFGGYFFSRPPLDCHFTGGTAVMSSGYTISNNSLTNSIASSSTSSAFPGDYGSSTSSSVFSIAYGGGISFAVGTNLHGDCTFRVHSIVNNISKCLSSNTLINCTASSIKSVSSPFTVYNDATSFSSHNRTHAYGGGISLSVGAYVSADYTARVTGDTTVSNSIYTISRNTLINCTASSTATFSDSWHSSSSSSNGASVYGGGLSLAIGTYVCDGFLNGETTLSNSSYTISNNTLTNCTASSSTSSITRSMFSSSSSNGLNAYGGGISIGVGAYVYSFHLGRCYCGTTVSNSMYIISSNILTNCTASTLIFSTSIFSSSSSSQGANSYGGGLSLAVGGYLYAYPCDFLGNTTVSNSSYTISRNTLTNCTASSSTSASIFNPLSPFYYSSSSSNGLNAYGGGISFVIGAYVYGSFDGNPSFFEGDTTVSNSSYIISRNTLTNCTASSSTSTFSIPSPVSSSSSKSEGLNAYGGGISIVVGPYVFSETNDRSRHRMIVSSFNVEISDLSSFLCFSSAFTSGFSNEALSFGGTVSVVFEAYLHPKPSSNTTVLIVKSSSLFFERCYISKSISSSCGAGTGSAAGGAFYVSILNADVIILSSIISDSSVRTGCATLSSSETYSLGGGLSVFRARNILINSTIFSYCLAVGISRAINVFVSGGGVFVKESESVMLESSFITESRVADAFPVGVVACGGGGIGTKNVPLVWISNSTFYNNSDSCLTAVIFLQQLNLDPGMVVVITSGSIISTDPSISVFLPVLNMSCGLNCTIEQQKRFRLNVTNSTLLAQNPYGQPYRSASVLSLPILSLVTAANSFLNCSFKSSDNVAVLVESGSDQMVVSCAPCEKPFTIAMASRSMNWDKLSSFSVQSGNSVSCRPLILKTFGSISDKEQQCPFGFSFCSTITNITVGFWTKFSVDGSISDAILCPPNYCGCRNIPGYPESSCQLFPPFAVEYQPDDALCNNNRTGVLCGGCKLNFTQSLNGHSCVHNDTCLSTLPWVWTITVIGYLIYALYIVITSMKISSGFVMCVLFYGQLSSFASLPSQFVDESEISGIFPVWVSKVTQFRSVLAFYGNTCYGLNMGAYEATAAQLCGPAIVLCVALLLTSAAKHLQPRLANLLQTHELNLTISIGATMINVLLLLFSSISSVVFQLITCQAVGFENVVFIDGRRKCEGPLYEGLIVVAVLLSGLPVVYWALLKFGKIPATTKTTICSAYTDSRYYWGAATLLFRFLMTVLFATAREFPSITALAMLICSICMLVLMISLRPYVEQRTYYMDTFCYFCLIIQFVLQGLIRNSESLGVAVTATNSFRPVLLKAARASTVLRCVCLRSIVSASSVFFDKSMAGTRRSLLALS
jgi:hypothetical protein